MGGRESRGRSRRSEVIPRVMKLNWIRFVACVLQVALADSGHCFNFDIRVQWHCSERECRMSVGGRHDTIAGGVVRTFARLDAGSRWPWLRNHLQRSGNEGK